MLLDCYCLKKKPKLTHIERNPEEEAPGQKIAAVPDEDGTYLYKG